MGYRVQALFHARQGVSLAKTLFPLVCVAAETHQSSRTSLGRIIRLDFYLIYNHGNGVIVTEGAVLLLSLSCADVLEVLLLQDMCVALSFVPAALCKVSVTVLKICSAELAIEVLVNAVTL